MKRMAQEKTYFEWFKKINSTEKWILTVVLSGFTYLGIFAYNNVSLPKDDKRIEDIQNHIELIEDKLNATAIEKAVMRNNILLMKEDIKEVKNDMKEGFRDLGNKMDENNRIVKVVRENTK